MKVLQLLTRKPLTYAANVGEGDLMDRGQSNAQVQALQKKAVEENCEVVVVSAQVSPCRPIRHYSELAAEEPKSAFGVFRSRYLVIFSHTLYQLSYKGGCEESPIHRLYTACMINHHI